MLNMFSNKSETTLLPSFCFAYIGFVFFLVSIITCTDGGSHKKYLPCALVVGGRNAAEGRFPYMCSIRDERSTNHSCGGTLIKGRWLLTAAHCLDTKYATSSGVYSEIYCDIYRKNERKTSKTYAVDTIYTHSKWESDIKKGYDIALIKLDREADLPVPKLASATTPYPRGDGFSVLGYGLTNSEKCTDKLQIGLDLDVVSKYKCSRDNMWGVLITSSMICAGTGSVDTAEGDSGGPFVQLDDPLGHYEKGDPSLDLVVGITSFGVGEARREKDTKPGVYTSVSFFREWIDCVIEGKIPKEKCPAISVEPLKIVAPPPSGTPSPTPPPVPCLPPKKSGVGYNKKDSLNRMKKAIEIDNSGTVKCILAQGMDPNTKYIVVESFLPINTSLLHQAAFYKAVESAKVLVDHEADVDIRDSRQRTPLHIAAEYDSLRVAKVLVDKGAKLNVKSKRGDSPLHYAAYYRHESIVKFLIKKGADVNLQNVNKETPFDVVCRGRDDADCNDETRTRLENLLSTD